MGNMGENMNMGGWVGGCGMEKREHGEQGVGKWGERGRRDLPEGLPGKAAAAGGGTGRGHRHAGTRGPALARGAVAVRGSPTATATGAGTGTSTAAGAEYTRIYETGKKGEGKSLDRDTKETNIPHPERITRIN